jgi:hypothetical protein
MSSNMRTLARQFVPAQFLALLFLTLLFAASVLAASVLAAPALAAPAHGDEPAVAFPPTLDSYGDADETSLWRVLENRVRKAPFNLVATVLFLCAIGHTFLTHRFLVIAHKLEHRHQERLRAAGESAATMGRISPGARFFHFLGEVEAVFGIWVIPLVILINVFVGNREAVHYVNHGVAYTEPIFVVVIMAIASTRPILLLAEKVLGLAAGLGNGSPKAWWLSILIIGPLLGSFITEPAAMTICASLLSRRVYSLQISKRLAYATLGLLFVTISVGGTLTNFAAPPVLMVAGPWNWDTSFMFRNFGWKAILGICLAVGAYFTLFRKELQSLSDEKPAPPKKDLLAPVGDATPESHLPIPLWVTFGHIGFMAFAVWHSHDAAHLIFTLLFFLVFVNVTEDFQSRFSLRTPVLVGFFLAGLVVHGGLQQWWIEPVLGRLGELPLMLGATGLTAFNDNAAITYLCTLVPSFTEGMKYAAVAGAVTGGGLTVIANAPNPAGQSILSKHFQDGISPMNLFIGALVPTLILGLCFLLF